MIGRLFNPTIDEISPRSLDREVLRQEKEWRRATKRQARGKRTISYFGHKVSLDDLDHTAVIGATGSGKNLVSGPTLKSLLDLTKKDPSVRLLFVEIKGEILQALEGEITPYHLVSTSFMEGESPVFLEENPSLYDVIEFNTKLWPDLEGNNAYFRLAARILAIAGDLLILDRRGGKLTLADKINFAFLSTDEMRTAISATELGKRIANVFLPEGNDSESLKTVASVKNELASRLMPFIPAAAKAQVTPSVSIVDFLQGKSEFPVLIFRIDPERISVDTPVINLLIRRAFETIAGTEPDINREKAKKNKVIWIDDFNFNGKLDRAVEGLEIIRAGGGVAFINCQSIAGLRSRDSYYDQANGLLANFPNKVFLRSGCVETSRWAVDLFAQFVRQFESWSTSYGEKGAAARVGENRVIENDRVTSDFLLLPPPSKENGVIFHLLTNLFGPEPFKKIPWHQIVGRHPKKKEVRLRKLPKFFQNIEFWSEEEKNFIVTGERPEGEESEKLSPQDLFNWYMGEFAHHVKTVVNDVGRETLTDFFSSQSSEDWFALENTHHT